MRQKRPRILYRRIGRMVCNRRQLPFDFLYPYVAGLRGIGLYLLQTCYQWLEGRLKLTHVLGLIIVN